MAIRGGTRGTPDDRNADDSAETLKDQREGRYMSHAEQGALSDRRAEMDAA